MKVLMVCLGNICRSPLAEGILQQKAKEKGLDISVDSAGTASYHIGSKPDERSIEVANKHGIDISKQKARQFKADDFYAFDLILAMDKSNLKNIKDLAPAKDLEAKAQLILDYTQEVKESEVPDPYYGEDDGFLKVYKMLDLACNEILKKS